MKSRPPYGAALAAVLLTIPLAAQGPFELGVASTGQGQILPFRIRQLDANGNPTNRVLNITSRDVLAANLRRNNPVLPVATWPPRAVLPNGRPGNHYLLVRFTADLDLMSVLSGRPADAVNSFLTGALSVVSRDPTTGAGSIVTGQAFVGGFTYLDDPTTPQLDPQLVQAVRIVGNQVVIVDSRANGFPRGFTGDVDLVRSNSFVFVPNADGVLATLETFPTNRTIQLTADSRIRDVNGRALGLRACAASTVGPDIVGPNLIGAIPQNGQQNVDPRSAVVPVFDKPLQPLDVGPLEGTQAGIGGVVIDARVGVGSWPLAVFAEPASHQDFCSFVIRPVGMLPGQTTITLTATLALNGLNGVQLQQRSTSSFQTGAGPGITNAPVAPEAIYVGRSGPQPGVSVVDVNGFGQGTGRVGTTNFVNNPNLGRPGIYPPLALGTSTLDAGGDGQLTLTRDHRGNTLLLARPLVGSIDDIHIGQPLDLVYNNTNINQNANAANHVNPETLASADGNTISIAPHPNPPRILFPAPNPARGIWTDEPTVTSSTGPPGRVLTTSPPCLPSPTNLLLPAPSGPLFGASFGGVFYGPQPPPPSPPPPPPFCPFTSRQQVGHFLYVLDRVNRQVVIVNSNRFTVLGTIPQADPVSMAMAPNLAWLAISNRSTRSVSILDIDPRSATFHQVIVVVRVGRRPSKMAWQPEGEDLLVCCRHSVHIISARSLSVRRVLRQRVNAPIDIAVTPRQVAIGFDTKTYFAFILNGDGTVVAYESGPSAIGPDTVVATVGERFRRARSLHVDPGNFRGGCWVTHVDASGRGQLSRIEYRRRGNGPIVDTLPSLTPIGLAPNPPRFFAVTRRIGGAGQPLAFAGNTIVDLAWDDVRNRGALLDGRSPIGGLVYARHSGKGQVKTTAAGARVAAQRPLLLFVALGDTGKVDVVDLATGRRLRTIDAPGISTLAHYWRQ